ncbi:pyridoxamine 5'-phosphate oxidase family protein [Streptomyces sp. NPDC049585]|uniref:pyridoxamine 5'-phosphate oxidase family protein n=1 Tax=Streptomyces sp. NPDC049585 TaxID=3155154 RepID=UPI003432B8CB
MTAAAPQPSQQPLDAIRSALRAHTTLTLAYVDEQGPQACAVLYALADSPDPTLLFVTAENTRHGRALLSGDARVAFTAQADGQDWTVLTGIQGRGNCRLLTGAAREAAWPAYSSRFPYVERTERLKEAMARTGLWELRPNWLRLVDNGRGFGHKTEWTPPA